MDTEFYKEFGIKWLKCIGWTFLWAGIIVGCVVVMTLGSKLLIHFFGDSAPFVVACVLLFLAFTFTMTMLAWDLLD